jgi:hypothetical protein
MFQTPVTSSRTHVEQVFLTLLTIVPFFVSIFYHERRQCQCVGNGWDVQEVLFVPVVGTQDKTRTINSVAEV